MRVVGLTGSIAMGKSTTAGMFRARGVPVHEADAAVHRLYRGAAVAPVSAVFPGVAESGVIDRARLAEAVAGDAGALAQLEAIVHPLVRASEETFLDRVRAEGHRLAVLDIPLLFETGAVDRIDVVVVVSAAAEIQRERVLARPGMTRAKLDTLLARQVSDEEKRLRAHFVVDSGRGLPSAARRVDAILRALAHTA